MNSYSKVDRLTFNSFTQQATLTEHDKTEVDSVSAENYARSLGAKIVLKKFHAEASRFPTREAFNSFIKFLVARDYNYRLENSVAQSVAFSLKAASLELRKLQEQSFELGSL